MFFLKTKHKVQLSEAIQIVMELKKDGEIIADKDVFKMPIISINCEKYHTEFVGMKVFLEKEQKELQFFPKNFIMPVHRYIICSF